MAYITDDGIERCEEEADSIDTGGFKENATYLVVFGCDGEHWSKIAPRLSDVVELWAQEDEFQPTDETRLNIKKLLYDIDAWHWTEYENVPFRFRWNGEQCYTEIIMVTP